MTGTCPAGAIAMFKGAIYSCVISQWTMSTPPSTGSESANVVFGIASAFLGGILMGFCIGLRWDKK